MARAIAEVPIESTCSLLICPPINAAAALTGSLPTTLPKLLCPANEGSAAAAAAFDLSLLANPAASAKWITQEGSRRERIKEAEKFSPGKKSSAAGG